MQRSSIAARVVLLLSVALGPFALGYVLARWMPSVWGLSPSLWGWAFLVGWFLIGRQLGRQGYGPAGLIAGVLPPLLGAGLFVQQFYLTPGEERSPGLLSLVGQLYPMIAVSPAASLIRILGVTELDSRVGILVAFAMVMGAFVVGFQSGRATSSR